MNFIGVFMAGSTRFKSLKVLPRGRGSNELYMGKLSEPVALTFGWLLGAGLSWYWPSASLKIAYGNTNGGEPITKGRRIERFSSSPLSRSIVRAVLLSVPIGKLVPKR